MSMLIGGAAPVAYLTDDQRNAPGQYRASVEVSMIGDDFGELASFATEFWPGSGLAGDAGDVNVQAGMMWGGYESSLGAGGSSRFGFVGVTRDSFGSAIGTCTVKLYRTSNDSLLDSTISDPDGNFLLNTPYYPDAHYIVAHKTGSPDVDGVTQNTLIGA